MRRSSLRVFAILPLSLLSLLACGPAAGGPHGAVPGATAPVGPTTANVTTVGPSPLQTMIAPTAQAIGRVPATTTMRGAIAGADITLRGRASRIPWQHLTSSVAGKRLEYFDLRGGKEQTIVYWSAAPICTGEVEVMGKVLLVRGASKRGGPGQLESKAGDDRSELHVDVESSQCLPSGDGKDASPLDITRRVARLVHDAMFVALEKDGARCPSIAQLRDAGLLPTGSPVRDAWGRELLLHCSGASTPQVRSAGPDARFETPDDIVEGVLVDEP